MMTRRDMLLATVLGSVSGLGMVSGCGSASTPDSAALSMHRSKFLLEVEPSGAIGVAEAKETIAQSSDLVLIGRIQGGELQPWNEGRAAFFLSEASAMIDLDEAEHTHEAGHDHKNCPFCNRNKSLNQSQAIVQFLDESGKVLAVDARELLSVEEGQLVVVQGRGKLDDLGTLVVAANGIYVRR